MTIATASIRVFSTWCSEARMVSERSKVTTRSIFGSMEAFSSGSSAFTASTTSMTLAPGCWRICTDTAGLPL